MTTTSSLDSHDAIILFVALIGIPILVSIVLFAGGQILRRACGFHRKLTPFLYLFFLIGLVSLSSLSWTYLGILWMLLSVPIAAIFPIGYSVTFCAKSRKAAEQDAAANP
jgi:hypothetical protein